MADAEHLKVFEQGVTAWNRSDAATAWQLGHVVVLSGPEDPSAYQPQIPADRERYDAVLRANSALGNVRKWRNGLSQNSTRS